MININKAENIAKDIIENSKNQKSYGTGLMFEHYLVGTLDKLNIDNLKSLRHIITKIIRDKEKTKAIINAYKK
jgi:hypothetical protein